MDHNPFSDSTQRLNPLALNPPTLIRPDSPSPSSSSSNRDIPPFRRALAPEYHDSPSSSSGPSSPTKPTAAAMADDNTNDIPATEQPESQHRKRPFSFMVTSAPRWTWVNLLILGLALVAIACSFTAIALSVGKHQEAHAKHVVDADALSSTPGSPMSSSESLASSMTSAAETETSEAATSSKRPRSISSPPPSITSAATTVSASASPSPAPTSSVVTSVGDPSTSPLPPSPPPPAPGAPGPPQEWTSFTLLSTLSATPTTVFEPSTHIALDAEHAGVPLFAHLPHRPHPLFDWSVARPGFDGQQGRPGRGGPHSVVDREGAGPEETSTASVDEGAVPVTQPPVVEGPPPTPVVATSFANTTFLTSFVG